MPSQLDVRIVKNNSITLQFLVKDKNEVPLNITDFIIKWQVKKTFKSEALITKSTGGHGISIIDAPNGAFSIVINAADTIDLPQGSYFHEAIVTDTQGKSVTLTDLDLAVGVFYLREQYTPQD